MSKRIGLRIPWAIPSLNSCRRKDQHCGAAATAPVPSDRSEDAYLWEAEEKWHVVARAEPAQRQKIDSDVFPPLNLRRSRRKPTAARKTSRSRVSKSSADSHWFSSEEEKECVEDGETELMIAPVLQRLKKKSQLKLPEGKVKESFAVVKKSENPYADFRSSMAEMIIENEMYGEADLEQLLHCFLLLNSRHHHPAIVRAFSDVWAALFPST